MRRALVLLLLAACNGEHESEMRFPAGGLEEFVLRFQRGSIAVRHPKDGEDAGTCVVKVVERGGAEALGAEKRFSATATDKRIVIDQRRNEEGLRLDVEVVVPRGVDIDLVLREGPVTVEGAYGRVAATTTTGDVAAALESCAGAKVKAAEGDVSITLRKPGIESGVTCETLAGDAALTVPAGFRGPVQVYSGSARLDLGKDPAIEFFVDPAKQSARGFAGTPLTGDEKRRMREEGWQPPAVWARTQDGVAAFRVR